MNRLLCIHILLFLLDVLLGCCEDADEVVEAINHLRKVVGVDVVVRKQVLLWDPKPPATVNEAFDVLLVVVEPSLGPLNKIWPYHSV